MDKILHQPLGGNEMPRFAGIATMMRLPYLDIPMQHAGPGVYGSGARQHESRDSRGRPATGGLAHHGGDAGEARHFITDQWLMKNLVHG